MRCEVLNKWFTMFDVNGDGDLDEHEFETTLLMMGTPRPEIREQWEGMKDGIPTMSPSPDSNWIFMVVGGGGFGYGREDFAAGVHKLLDQRGSKREITAPVTPTSIVILTLILNPGEARERECGRGE